MMARIAVADELLGARQQVLLGELDALLEWRRAWLVEDLHARARVHVHLEPIKARVLVLTAWADAPHLAGRQRVDADRVLTLDLGCRHELLHAVLAKRVA